MLRRRPRTDAPSATHLQHTDSGDEAVHAVEIDDERNTTLILVEILLHLRRIPVHGPTHGIRIVDAPAPVESHESLRGRIEIAVEQHEVGILADRLENSTLRIAHPDGELRIAVDLHTAAEGKMRLPQLIDVRDADRLAALDGAVDDLLDSGVELELREHWRGL